MRFAVKAKLLGTVVRMLKEVEAEIAGMIHDERKRGHPAQRGQNHPIARRLAEIHGVGPQSALSAGSLVEVKPWPLRMEKCVAV
jgi:hypothetical protein